LKPGSDDEHVDQIVAVSWSECGTWLASAGLDKRVIVWDAASSAPLAKFKSDAVCFGGCAIGSAVVTALRWLGGTRATRATGSTALAMLDLEGQLGVVDLSMVCAYVRHVATPTEPQSKRPAPAQTARPVPSKAELGFIAALREGDAVDVEVLRRRAVVVCGGSVIRSRKISNN
jgi:hypothetical protein